MNTITTLKRGAITIHAIPVLNDNLVYLVCREDAALLVDAGEAAPVKAMLESEQLRLTGILSTHRHGDHTAGLSKLQPLVCSSATVASVHTISVPGHTPDDLAFYLPDAGVVFTGDALINGACGRVPSAEAAVTLYESLQRLAALPDDTLVLGGHDYLQENMRFALAENPACTAARERLECYRIDAPGAIFATIAEEKSTNPFLQSANADDFARLRQRKDRF
ncbi:MAG: MBL fold metallo-hydrolase [Kiritimatiellae bacterium]|jgi:hydroxyacylglutathione hydrolase|nr:MBL fold metallo-hydrolase [Kiritimatiellia bacterium]